MTPSWIKKYIDENPIRTDEPLCNYLMRFHEWEIRNAHYLPPVIYTSTQVAKMLQVDLKTVHNWINRGALRCFRTPGRHIRITKKWLQNFIEKYGYKAEI